MSVCSSLEYRAGISANTYDSSIKESPNRHISYKILPISHTWESPSGATKSYTIYSFEFRYYCLICTSPSSSNRMFPGYNLTYPSTLIISHSCTNTLITVFSINMSGFCYWIALFSVSYPKSNLNSAISWSTLYASSSKDNAFFRLFEEYC